MLSREVIRGALDYLWVPVYGPQGRYDGHLEKEAADKITDAILALLAKERIDREALPIPFRNHEAPLRDITQEWNACQDAYYRRCKRHYHGGFRVPKSTPWKRCAILVVFDVYQGEPIRLDPATWPNGQPDYHDLHRLIAMPYDEMFRGPRGGAKEVHVAGDMKTAGGVGRLIADAVNAFLGRTILEEMERETHSSAVGNMRDSQGGT